MSSGIPESERFAAAAFLKAFPRKIARRGAEYAALGKVRNIQHTGEELGFTAEVQGDRVYRTTLQFDLDDCEWVSDCSCPYGGGCKHCYALMRVLLDGTHGRSARTPKASIEATLAAALGRKLKADEVNYLGRISAAFSQAQFRGGVFVQDLQALGLPISGFSWDRPAVWPAPPVNELEFWHYIVLFGETIGFTVPDWLLPISDPGPLRAEVEAWRHTREVERWERLLAHLSDDQQAAGEGSELDLRVRFHERAAVLEVRRAGAKDFEVMKSSMFRELPSADASRLTPEAAVLRRFVVKRAEQGYGPEIRYSEIGSADLIGGLLRLPWIASRLVSETGVPFDRPSEPLRWELGAAADERGDYRLRLVDPSGQPAGNFLFVAPGTPNLYVTRTAVWTGPALDAHALTPGEETRIPARALETGNGVRFLRRHGVPLPPRIESRVRTVPLKLRVRCEIQPMYAGACEETCIVQVLGEAADGSLGLVYHRDGWSEAKAGAKRDSLTFYDRSPLAGAAAILEPLPLKWDGWARHWHFKVTRKFADTFSSWLATVSPEVTVELIGELASFQSAAIAGTLRLSVEETELDWFDLRVVLDVSETQLSKAELKLLLDARGKWVRLADKGWRRLEFQLSEDEDEQLSRLGLNARDLSSEPQKLHALQLADRAAKRFMPEQQFENVQRRASELQTRVTPPIPAGIRAELRPYQIEGFHFLAYLSANRFGGVLADDMGLGKTLQTLTWLAWLREEHAESRSSKSKSAAPPPALVVCPKSVADNWRAEVERFLPGLQVRVWHRLDIAQLPNETESASLHVINYAQLRSVGEALAAHRFLAVILDEGQFIKNPDSATAKLARGLRAEHRIILSGTPIENRLLDLWSLMAFAMPGVLGQRAGFARNFDAKEDPFARRRLAARVRPFVLRRTKVQVAKDLPDRIEEDLYCELEGEQKTLYRAELKRAQQMLLRVETQKQLAQERFHFLTSLLRLRQICCDPRLVKPDSKGESAKLEALLEQLEPLVEEGQKVLVFSQFVEMLGILRSALTERGWPHFYLAGDTENRGELVRDFQSAEGAAIFLVSLKAGGFGLNLTAASYVVLFDPWWNPAVETQAIDRTHRIGQVNKVIAYRLLIKGSIEEKIRLLQKQKRGLAEDVLGEEKFAQSLSLDDLHFLFSE
jgi:hypothetical protein